MGITLSTAWGWFLTACAAVVTVSKAAEIIKKTAGKGDMLKKITEHDEEIEQLKESNRIMLQTLLAIVNHEIDGNGIDGLKQVREDLQKHLIER